MAASVNQNFPVLSDQVKDLLANGNTAGAMQTAATVTDLGQRDRLYERIIDTQIQKGDVPGITATVEKMQSLQAPDLIKRIAEKVSACELTLDQLNALREVVTTKVIISEFLKLKKDDSNFPSPVDNFDTLFHRYNILFHKCEAVSNLEQAVSEKCASLKGKEQFSKVQQGSDELKDVEEIKECFSTPPEAALFLGIVAAMSFVGAKLSDEVYLATILGGTVAAYFYPPILAPDKTLGLAAGMAALGEGFDTLSSVAIGLGANILLRIPSVRKIISSPTCLGSTFIASAFAGFSLPAAAAIGIGTKLLIPTMEQIAPVVQLALQKGDQMLDTAAKVVQKAPDAITSFINGRRGSWDDNPTW